MVILIAASTSSQRWRSTLISGNVEPAVNLLPVQSPPGRRPPPSGLASKAVLGLVEGTREECGGGVHVAGCLGQPARRDDRVVVVAEGLLQTRNGFRESRRCHTHRGRRGLGSITAALGFDADSVHLGVIRVLVPRSEERR